MSIICSDISPEPAIINLERIHALAALLSAEAVAKAFAALDTVDQVAIFGVFEKLTGEAKHSLAHEAG